MRAAGGLGLLLLVAQLGYAEASVGDVEQSRIEHARSALGEVVERYQDVVDRSDSGGDVTALGESLWRRAVQDVQRRMQLASERSPGSERADDRPLYWARLAIQRALAARDDPDGPAVDAADRQAFERASRGMSQIRFPEDATTRVLITGFDPFLLDEHIDQSNPSGLAALTLDGVDLATAVGPARVEAALLPVRFEDFDAGVVEELLGPLLGARPPPDLLVTISMGRDQFDLERFPGRRRSAEVPDNRNALTGASVARPLVPKLDGRPLDGPEFLEFTLPATAMAGLPGRWRVRDNRNVVTLERGAQSASSLVELARQTAVAGSGGGYLSNEVAYRALLLAGKLGVPTAVGHLHTPRVAGYEPELERAMVQQIRDLLIRAVEARADARRSM